MRSTPPPTYLFATHREAEHAIHSLASTGIDVRHLSLVGTGVQSDEYTQRLHTVASRIKAWDGVGAFWGGVWSMLLAPAVFFLPGLGPLAMSGPLAGSMVKAMENPSVGGGASALDTALITAGVHRDGLAEFDAALRAEKYALIFHGNAEDAELIDLFLAPHRWVPVPVAGGLEPVTTIKARLDCDVT